MIRLFTQVSGRSFIVLTLLWLCIAAIPARTGLQQQWKRLAERTVNHTTDHTEFSIDNIEQDLQSLRVKVTKGAINLHRCRVEYKNGQTQDIDILNSIPQGEESKVIDLPANNGTVTKLSFWYDTKNRGIQKATVEVWGKAGN